MVNPQNISIQLDESWSFEDPFDQDTITMNDSYFTYPSFESVCSSSKSEDNSQDNNQTNVPARRQESSSVNAMNQNGANHVDNRSVVTTSNHVVTSKRRCKAVEMCDSHIMVFMVFIAMAIISVTVVILMKML